MKSIHIIGSRLLGGAESFYMRLVRALHDSGDQVTSVSRADSLVARELQNIVPQAHASMSSQWDIFSRMKISKLIKQQQPDIVQTYMTRATVLTHVPPNKGTVHIARLGGYYNIKRFKHAHAWIGNTKGICDFLIQGGLPADKVFYIGNFVGETTNTPVDELQLLRRNMGIPDDAYIITGLGRLTHKKGFDTLVKAFDQLPATIHDRPVHLVIAGDGPMREEWQQLAAGLNSAARIHWAGWQTVTGPYYEMADLFVCPSRHEPLGNVILEGWAYAKPVISTASLGGEELIEHGQDGILVPVDEPQVMADAMKKALQDEAMREAIAKAGHAKVNANFTQQAIVQQYHELYKKLAGN